MYFMPFTWPSWAGAHTFKGQCPCVMNFILPCETTNSNLGCPGGELQGQTKASRTTNPPPSEVPTSFIKNGKAEKTAGTNPQVLSALNGQHGEWTNGDDMPRKSKGRKGASAGKVVARMAAKTILNQVGAPQETYGMIAKAIAGMKVSAKRKGKNSVNRVKAFSSGVVARGMSVMNPIHDISSSRKLSVAASRYLLAFTDPFHNKARTAYIPQTPTCRTQKITGYVRGSFSTGTAGHGFLMFSPCAAKDNSALYYSSSTYAGTTFAMPALSNTNGVFSGFIGNLPYGRNLILANTVGNTIESRVVSMSARVYYTGTVVGCGGTIYSYSDPDTDNIVGLDEGSIGTRDICEIRPIEVGKSYTTVVVPARGSQITFPPPNSAAVLQLYPYSDAQSVVDPNQTGSTAVGTPCAGFIVVAPNTTPITFNYEIILHIEYNGQGIAQAALTPSAADTLGFDAVQSLLADSVRLTAADPVTDFPTVCKRELARRGISLSPIPDY